MKSRVWPVFHAFANVVCKSSTNLSTLSRLYCLPKCLDDYPGAMSKYTASVRDVTRQPVGLKQKRGRNQSCSLGANMQNCVASPPCATSHLWSLLGEDDYGPDIFLHSGETLIYRFRETFDSTHLGGTSIIHTAHTWLDEGTFACGYGLLVSIYSIPATLGDGSSVTEPPMCISSFCSHFQALDMAISRWSGHVACLIGGLDGGILHLLASSMDSAKPETNVSSATLHLNKISCAACTVATGHNNSVAALVGKDGRCFVVNFDVPTVQTALVVSEFAITLSQADGRATNAAFGKDDSVLAIAFWAGHIRVYSLVDPTKPENPELCAQQSSVWVQTYALQTSVNGPNPVNPSSSPSFVYWLPMAAFYPEKTDEADEVLVAWQGQMMKWSVVDAKLGFEFDYLANVLNSAVDSMIGTSVENIYEDCFGLCLQIEKAPASPTASTRNAREYEETTIDASDIEGGTTRIRMHTYGNSVGYSKQFV